MKNGFVAAGLLIIAISIVVLACGCTSPGSVNQSANSLPADKYLALYEEHDTEGSVIQGNGTLMYIPVPCPQPRPFDYNGSFGYGEQYPTVNDDLKAMYGTYTVLSSPAGGYSTAWYTGIYGFPYILHSGLVINGIDAAGTINASFKNGTIIIKTGDKWQSPVTTEVRNESHYVADNFTFTLENMRPFVMQYNSTWTVENKGVFPKSNIAQK